MQSLIQFHLRLNPSSWFILWSLQQNSAGSSSVGGRNSAYTEDMNFLPRMFEYRAYAQHIPKDVEKNSRTISA